MPTPHQIKKIATKTALISASDRIIYREPIEGAQIFRDAVNNMITEYATLPWLTNATSGMLTSMDPKQHSLLMEVGLNIAQDMVMHRFTGGDSRTVVRSLVLFGVSSVVTDQLQSRVEMLN